MSTFRVRIFVSDFFNRMEHLRNGKKLFLSTSSVRTGNHLSENEGLCDDHNLIHSDSLQYKLIKENAESILQRGINVTLEAGDQSFEDIRECYFLIEEILSF